MEAARSSETLIYLTTAQYRNPEKGHHLIKNRCEVPKTTSADKHTVCNSLLPDHLDI
jgi:hypothetical protein